MMIRVPRSLTAALLLGVFSGAYAQDYGNFSIGRGFMPDPQIGTGQTGGRSAASRFGSQCLGRIDATPDHVIEVTSTVNLRLHVQSEVDSTLVLVGPAGVFCDDDSGGNFDAAINAMLTPGRYDVYVGHIDHPGRYVLALSEISGVSGMGDNSLYRDFTLGAGFMPDPQYGTGQTGGPVNASRYGNHCIGNVDATPDHTLTVTSPVDLRLYVNSTVDSTLLIAGPNVVWCDDDSHGNLDAEIKARFEPGTYHIYIGHIGGHTGEYRLTITERR